MVDVGDRGALCDWTYLVLRRSLLKVVIGFALISHGTNLLLLTTGKLKRGAVPFWWKGIRGRMSTPATGTDLDGDRHQFCRDCLHAGSCIPNLSVAGHRRSGSPAEASWMTLLVVLPILIPLCTGTVCLLCWGRVRRQRVISVVSGLIWWSLSHYCCMCGPMGSWCR